MTQYEVEVVKPVSKEKETISVSVTVADDGVRIALFNHAHPECDSIGFRIASSRDEVVGRAFANDLLAAYQKPLTLAHVLFGLAWWAEAVAEYEAAPDFDAAAAFDAVMGRARGVNVGPDTRDVGLN